MKTRLRVAESIHFDHAAHFSPIFGGKSGRVDTHRVDIVGADLRAETGRAIVGQRNAVNHELGLILRAPRVQYRIAFIEPARLAVHQILNRTAGQGSQAALDGFSPDFVDRSSLIGIEQRSLRFHGHRFLCCRHLQFDRVIDRYRRMDVDRFRDRCETGLLDGELVEAIGKALHVQRAVVAGGQGIVVLIGLARNLDRGFDPKSGRVGNRETQLAPVALGKSANPDHQQDEKGNKARQSAHRRWEQRPKTEYRTRSA